MVDIWLDRSGVRFASSKPCSVCPIWQVQKPSPMEYLTIHCNTLTPKTGFYFPDPQIYLRLAFFLQLFAYLFKDSLLVYMYTLCMQYMWEPEEDNEFPWTGVAGSYIETPDVGDGNQTCVRISEGSQPLNRLSSPHLITNHGCSFTNMWDLIYFCCRV